jgi:cytochrome c5
VSDHDRRFFNVFTMVLGGLVLFTIIIYFVAHSISGKTQAVWSTEERASAAALEERIAPMGTVAIAGEIPPDAPAPAAAATGAAEVAAPAAGAPAAASGEDVYNSACFACHAVGVAGAPKLGDRADWGPRIAQGRDTLVQHAIDGFQGSKGVMPPKGGRVDFSDEAIAAAVDYMVSRAQ